MSKRVKKELGSSSAVTWLWWDCVGEGEEKETEVWEPSKCHWSQSQRKALSRKMNAMLVLIGKVENQFLEIGLAKLSWEYSVNSIHLLSALFLTLMDQAGAYKANGMVPSIDFIYNLSPSPLRWAWTPETRSALWNGRIGLPTSTVLSANWLPGEENVFGSNSSTQQARDLKKRQEEADMWFWRQINTISCARNKLKRLNGKTPISSAKRENQRKIHFNRSLLLPWQPNDCHIFCQVLFIVGFSNISNTLTIMVLYPFCCPNRIHQYFRLFLSFLEMTIPSLSQLFCPYIHKQTPFAARVGWLNSQKSIVMLLIVCTSTPGIQFHLVGLATAEGSGGNHVAWWLIGWALETGNLGLNPDFATYKLGDLGQVI